eukprot:CAMPEP_0202459292 /NCGR_PEP_ID=MMETSP1360-20130828/34388_1 /ASSEMBLY_ACC=CAM_ASM_000848 /TAXON_ID=515479 /ORGANISM="Licmophora paradoxa, Strain CCMP2313" /LENGTH=39 /DNA_ID= /DNA_START= /DNA_END= /DNA_ORIENTATION=
MDPFVEDYNGDINDDDVKIFDDTLAMMKESTFITTETEG